MDLLNFGRPRKMRVVCNGNPALRNKSLPVTEITQAIKDLAERMIVTMKENDIPGVGLAAPQVGINTRLIVIDTRDPSRKKQQGSKKHKSEGETLLEPRMPLALVNPEILSASAKTVTAEEGCLSLPGIGGTVTRPAKVLLRALDINGKQIITECEGLLARCLQHEIDHLDGILFLDHSPKEEQLAAANALNALAQQEMQLMTK